MTSLLATPSTPYINGSAVLGYLETLPIPDGFRMAYIDERPAKFKNEDLKTESAYMLHLTGKTTKNLPKIIESGRLVVLQFKNGVPLGVLIHPKLELISDITKFILFPNDSQAFLLPGKFGVVKSTEDHYKKMSSTYFGF